VTELPLTLTIASSRPKHRGPSIRVAERVANVYGRTVDIV
jgi:hypothetical protein